MSKPKLSSPLPPRYPSFQCSYLNYTSPRPHVHSETCAFGQAMGEGFPEEGLRFIDDLEFGKL